MGLKRKQKLMEQRVYFEHKLQDRLSFLSGKGIKSPKADKDTIVRKFQADVRAVNRRLRAIADNEKRAEEVAKAKAGKAAEAAAPKKEESGKGEKPKKAPEEGKGKKTKPETKAAPPKAPEGGKGQKPTKSAEEGKAAQKKKEEEK